MKYVKEKMQKIITQAGALLGVGTTVFLVRKLWRRELHPVVSAHCQLVTKEPALAEVLSELAAVGVNEQFELILEITDEVIRLANDKIKNKSNQWHIARLNGDIIRRAKDMCKIKGRMDEASFQTVIYAKEEHIPQLESLLDNVLHNHLLDS
jgi:hypothetical protein